MIWTSRMKPALSVIAGVYYGNEDVLIGAANFGAGYYRRFAGTIDDVRIWDHARDGQAI